MIQLRAYLLTWLVLWLLGLGLLLSEGYEQSFLTAHHWRSSFADSLYPHLTHLGDGLLLSGIIGLVLLRKQAWLMPMMMAAMVIVLFAVAFAKQLVFPEWARPVTVFGEAAQLHLISTERLAHNAFPSGHATGVAAGITFLALAADRSRQWIGVLLALIGGILSWTRLYIGVHFLGDIVAGSMLGVGIALAVSITMGPRFRRYWDGLDDGQRESWSRILYGLSVVSILMASWAILVRNYL